MKTRKSPRLREYDYGTNGAYFITVCSHAKQHLFCSVVGRGLAPAEVHLSNWGKIIEKQLLELEKRYTNIKIDKYVIMPNHVHIILMLYGETAGASPRPTVSDIICAWKSLSTHQCRLAGFMGKLWQTSFHDHIIRDEQDYFTRWRYIDDNPAKWAEDEYFSPI